MKKSFISLMLAVFAVFLIASCGGGSGGSNNESTINLTGNWKGVWQSTADTKYKGTIQANLIQDNLTIKGNAIIANSPCMKNGSLSGTIQNNNNISFGVFSGGNTIVFTASYTSTIISGTYLITAGNCAGDVGTFSLEKQ